MKVNSILDRLKQSNLFKDSFWAVFGNGIGNALLLIAGILIARFLGKDLYGEYGLVKTTMFYIADFATFGLGYTSTKFIAEYIQKDKSKVKSIINASLRITLISSLLMCVLLIVFAKPLALYINAEQMTTAFRFLGVIIVCRALGTTSAGILSGYKLFKNLGINNIISGFVMLVVCVPLTYFFDIVGSLFSLLIAQVLLVILNNYQVYKRCLIYGDSDFKSFDVELLKFSFPVAIQEFTFTLASLGTSLLLTKYASLGELGIYTACAQWNAIILFIPRLLSNVVLSYLSSAVATSNTSQNQVIRKMLLINFICAIIPFFIVLVISPIIVSLYGPSFIGMKRVLNVLIFSTIFECISSVFKNSFISEGRNWLLFIIRSLRDILTLIILYFLLIKTNGVNAAYNYALFAVCMSIFFLLCLGISYSITHKHRYNHL